MLRTHTMTSKHHVPQPEPEPLPRVVIIGVGNLLLTDEGIGVHAVMALQKAGLPPDVRVIDGGTSPDVITYCEAGEKLIIIDAMQAGYEPGTIYRLHPPDLALVSEDKVSAHQLGVIQSLELMKLAGREPPETVIIGVEPQTMDWGTELSATLREKLPEIITTVIREISARP
ncbi:MAG: HyaD/HybD family hydrogenase maturation endopeptidase [Chloroflexota bacterium]